VRRFDGRLTRWADDDAFAGSQSVGLNDNGRMEELNRFFELLGGCAHGVICSGDVMALQKVFGEALAAFKHGGGTRRAEDTHAVQLKSVDYAQRQGQFRANDGEVWLLGQGDGN
jgi:hypothetical protein